MIKELVEKTDSFELKAKVVHRPLKKKHQEETELRTLEESLLAMQPYKTKTL